MNKKSKLLIVGLLLAGLLTAAMGGIVLAQDDAPTTPLEAAAQALGITADELSNQLWGGRTLADVADQAGVDLQTVRDAVEAAQTANVKASIEQAVADGRIDQAHADWLLQGLDQGYLNGGFGLGCRGGFGGKLGRGGMGDFGGMRGFGGMHGFGNFSQDENPTSTSPSTFPFINL